MTKPSRKPRPVDESQQPAEPQAVDIEQMLNPSTGGNVTAEPWKPGDPPRANPGHAKVERVVYPPGTILDSNTFEPIFPDDPRYAQYAGQEHPAGDFIDTALKDPSILDDTLREDAPEDLTIGEVIGQITVDPETPTLPGFVMSDEPLEIPSVNFEPEPSPPPAGVSAANTGGGIPDAITPTDAQILSPSAQRIQGYAAGGTVRYEGRIRIMDAHQYMGRLENAPDWIDRNWIGYADYDELRKLEAGPCLRVPLLSGAIAICRIGDFVVQQEVVLAAGMPPDMRTEVWAKDDFVKNFMPVRD